MAVSRGDVLDALAARSRPSPPRTTEVAELAAALDADCQVVRTHLADLADCGLVRREGDDNDDDGVRVTRVGAAVAAMDLDDLVVVDTGGDQ